MPPYRSTVRSQPYNSCVCWQLAYILPYYEEKWRSYCACLEEANMTAAVSPIFLRKTACVITSVHQFISWGPIIMKAFGVCDAQFYILHNATVQIEYDMKNNPFVQLTVSNAQ